MNNNQWQILRVLYAAELAGHNLSSKQISKVLENLLVWWNIPQKSVAGYLGFMKPYVKQERNYTGKYFYSKRIGKQISLYTTTWRITKKGIKLFNELHSSR